MSNHVLSPEERRRRGAQLCARLARDVAGISSKGLGGWPRTWEMVDPASADFWAALTNWEADPTPEALEVTRIAYRALLDAWRTADRQFELQRVGGV